MSKIRNKLIATLTVFALLFTSLSAVMFASNNFAKAEEENNSVAVFMLQDGASSGYLGEVEEIDHAGLRWDTIINGAFYKTLPTDAKSLEFGTLIAPAKAECFANDEDFESLNFDNTTYITFDEAEAGVDGKIYVSNVINANAIEILSSLDDNGEYVMRSAIRYEEFEDEGINIKDGYATELVAKAYVKITNADDSVEYVYSTADTVRSLRNSVAFNLVTGFFNGSVADSLKKFALDGDIISCGSQEVAYNEEITVTFSELVDAEGVEFILNSKAIPFSFDQETGAVTFTAVSQKNDSLYLSAFYNGNIYYKELIKETVDKTSEISIIVDKDGEEVTALDKKILSVSMEGGVATLEDNKVALSFESEATAGNKDYVVTLETENSFIKVTARYYTSYIKTAEEFVKTFTLTDGVTTNTVASLNLFDGYYMLANNIDFAGETMPTNAFTYAMTHADNSKYSPLYTARATIGLTGTFDGNGNTIYNLKAPIGGIFGTINGTVKNVAFVNASSASTSGTLYTGIFATAIFPSAKLVNLYVDSGSYKDTKASAGQGFVALLCDTIDKDITITDCYFKTNLHLALNTSGAGANRHDATYNNLKWLTKTGNKAIVISTQSLSHRYNILGQSVYYDGTLAGSTDVKPQHDYTGGSSAKAASSRAAGAVYRYISVEEMVTYYNGDPASSTITEALQTLLSTWNTDYFAKGDDGRLYWKTNYNDYRVYYNGTEILDDAIACSTDGDKQLTISVKDSFGNVVNDSALTYELTCEDGSVSLSGAVLTIVKPGFATVTIKKGANIVREISVTIHKPIIDRTNETIILDKNGEEVTVLNEEILSASVEEGTATVIDGNKVALSFPNEKDYADKDYVVTLETEYNLVKFTAHYYTAYIWTAEELVKAFELAKGDLTTASKVTDLATFDGYYKLATNITFTDSNQPTEKYSYALDSGSDSNADIAELFNSSIKGNYGLTGTFDGDGYTIYNLKTQNGGLFGLVSGTIKNVGFVQLSSATPTTGVLARFVYRSGHLENVYIKSDKYDGSKAVASGALFHCADYYFTLTNCYFEINLHLYNITADDDYDTNTSLSHRGASSVIMVSSQILQSRYNLWWQAAAYRGDANATLSNVTKNLDGNTTYAVTGTTTTNIGRYDDVSKLYEAYNEKEDDGETLTTRASAIQSLLGNFSSEYFDTSDGYVSWNMDFTGYTLYADNELVEESSVPLHTKVDGEKSFTIKNARNLPVLIDGFTFEQDGKAVTVDGNKLTARIIGESTIQVKKRNAVAFTITVNVDKTDYIDMRESTEVVRLGLNQGKVITLEGIDIINAFTLEEGYDVKFEDGEVIMTDCVPNTDFVLYLEDLVNAYMIKAHAYSAIITTADEFVEVFGLKQDVSSFADLPNYDGYYILANNIDLSGVEFKYGYTEIATTKNIAGHGLTGTFDGQGYTISNLVAPEGGLFPAIHGTIRNVAFINADVKVKVYARSQNFVEPGGKNYTVNGQNDPQYVVTEREPARDKDGQLSYSSTTSSSGILSKYLGKATLENIYISYGATTPVEFLNGADSSNYTHRLNKAALTVVADSQAKLFNVYFECTKGDDDDTPADENIRLAIRSENYENSGRRHIYFQNANNKVILVTKSAIEARGSSTRYGATGHVAGSSKESFIDIFNVVALDSAGIKYGNELATNLEGTFYRYVSVEEMSGIYQDSTDTRSAYLKTLLATFDSNYFTVDSTTGVITWNTNVNG